MNSDVSPSIRGLRSPREWHVIGLLVLAAAAGGFCTGVTQQRELVRLRVPAEIVATTPAPGYAQLRSERTGPNANLYSATSERLGESLPDSASGFPVQTTEQRAEVLAARSLHRAYDGAPPTIPHVVVAESTFECLTCHEKGAIVAGKHARAMSHERHDSCTQCHVAAGGPPSPPPPPLASNSFVGQTAWSKGQRTWPGSPPRIPHSTLMRKECASCHGVGGALGLRTPHPLQVNVSAREWRESCPHCHLPSAALDPIGGLGPGVIP